MKKSEKMNKDCILQRSPEAGCNNCAFCGHNAAVHEERVQRIRQKRMRKNEKGLLFLSVEAAPKAVLEVTAEEKGENEDV